MNRNQLLLADLPTTTWLACSNIQLSDRYQIPREVVRHFRKEYQKPAQPTRPRKPQIKHSKNQTISYKQNEK